MDIIPYLEARALFFELVYYGPDILLHAFEFGEIIENYDELLANNELNQNRVSTSLK